MFFTLFTLSSITLVKLMKPFSKKKIMIIGDVHGCLDELKEIIKKKPDRDEYYIVGDLVNKGPSTRGVVQYCMENNIKCIMGNHDYHMVTSLKENPESKYKDYQLSKEEISFLENLPSYRRIPEYNLLLVHAGIVPNVELDQQNKTDMYYMRDITEDGKASYSAKDRPWAKYYRGSEFIIFGHDAKRGLQKYDHALGLDTGCCYGNYLTAITYPEEELIQVKAKEVYSPITNKND